MSQSDPILLGVNIDHVATLRQSRGTRYPEPIQAALAAEQAGVAVELDIGPGRIMPRGPSLDSSRLRQELGFAPQYDLAQGLAEYLAWIRQG